MRMWMVDPQMLCTQHLVGEHGEIHKFRKSFVKGHSITGRISPVVQIEPSAMKFRHDELSFEMEERGLNHHSHYTQPDLSMYSEAEREAKVDKDLSIKDLMFRCKDCRKRIKWLTKQGE